MGKANSPLPSDANEMKCTDNGHVSTGEQSPDHPVPTNGNAVPIEVALKAALIGKINTNKMPVSLLYEVLSRRGTTAQYQFLPPDAKASHWQVFRYLVSCPDGDAIGWGQTKKEAKHAAARILMDKLGVEYTTDSKVVGRKTPISVLQEVLSRRGICPQYFLHEEGTKFARTFNYRVSYEDREAMGAGKSKKDAKQAAAKAMIDMLAGYAFWDTHAYDANWQHRTTNKNGGPSGKAPNTEGGDTSLEGKTDSEKGAKRRSQSTTQLDGVESQRKKRSKEQEFALAKNVTI